MSSTSEMSLVLARKDDKAGRDYKPGRDNFFDELPPEIRAIIFGFCDIDAANYWVITRCLECRHGPYEPHRPYHTYGPYHIHLIAALRSQSRAYQQLLGMFFEQNRFRLDEGNSWSFSCMSNTTRSLITKLTIQLQLDYDSAHMRGLKYRYTELLPPHLNKACQELTSLRDLELCTYWSSLNSYGLGDPRTPVFVMFPTAFPAWLRSCTKLDRLSITFNVQDGVRTYFPSKNIISIQRLAEHVSQQVGVEGKGVLHGDIYHHLHYEWLAPEGETMDWSCVRAKGYDNWNFWEKAEATLREENGAFTVTQ